MKTTIIPRDISGFNAYVNNSTAYLLGVPAPPGAPAGAAAAPANYLRLGLSDTEMNQWRFFRDQWNLLYPSYSQKEESRTTAITRKLRKVQRQFIDFAAPRLRRMSGSENATEDDAAALGFTLTRRQPTHPTAPIDNIPVFGMKPIGGGEVKFSVRPFHDSKRASKFPGAEIEIRYAVLKTGDPMPAHIEELPNEFISSKAEFVLDAGTAAVKNILYAAVRWVVISNPKRNGQWTNIQMTVVA